MKLGIYCIRDNMTEYQIPTYAINDAAAVRDFELLCSREGTIYNFRRQDFSFYKVGEFDTETGVVSGIPLEVLK